MNGNSLTTFLNIASEALINNQSNSELIIRSSQTDSGNEYKVEFRERGLIERLKNYFHIGISSSTAETWKNLKTLVGEKRLERIFLRKELGLSHKLMQSNQVLLTPAIMHRILIGLADVRIEDLKEAAAGIDSGIDLSEFSVQELDELYNQLFPLEQIREIFFKNCQAVGDFDKPNTSGKGFKGLQERVWCIIKAREHFIEKSASKPEKLQGMKVELLTSRLGDREPTVGSVVRLDDNYYEVKKVIADGGACVTIWQELRTDKTLIACRGTAVRYSAQSGYLSGVNDLLPELGFLGVRKIWPELKQYLKDNQVEKVEILGKSLGGAQAQYLTTLIAGVTSIQVNSLTTYCSVGTPPKVHEVYQQIFAPNVLNLEPEIYIFRNTGEEKLVDYIPTLGGPHLKSEEKTSVYYLAAKETNLESSSYMPEVTGRIIKYFKLLRSFGLGHTHQTTLKPFRVYESTAAIDEEVQLGTKMEKVRSYVASFFNILTLTLFSRQDFESFYNQEKTQFEDALKAV